MSSNGSPLSSSAPSSSADDPLFEKWRKNLSWITGLGLSEEEKQIRQKERQERIEPLLLKKCNKVKDSLMTTSPSIVFMLRHLRLSGCLVEPEHIQCVPCGNTTAGGFSPELGGILVCSQGFSNRKHMENTIVHELLHMYDHCKFKVDWGNLRHHACSEVCVRRRAILSVAQNPNCPDRQAAETAVNEVWESCFNDTRPFDEMK
ncbi:hypothetical protein Clacol_006164 [Clathrus columnatus]|uniref:Mitochondrial inner membrane protease ATP23 n=1 Tax=Clathrus columnatus TaxID=1419009 RepID=A0AAV5ABA8_9AGAM|nr:hypothetical protein Clacol_006164 [Clathrus columnatus]